MEHPCTQAHRLPQHLCWLGGARSPATSALCSAFSLPKPTIFPPAAARTRFPVPTAAARVRVRALCPGHEVSA